MQTIQVGLIGLGTVGSGVVQILQRQADLLTKRLGARLQLARVATRHPERRREVQLPVGHVTADVLAVLHDPDIDIVVELIGGYEPARTYLLEAIKQGKHVVTANKALLAQHGQELFQTAVAQGVDIGFEASVGGGMPIIRTIKEALVANQFLAISSIINGTTNYLLSRMSDHGLGAGEDPRVGDRHDRGGIDDDQGVRLGKRLQQFLHLLGAKKLRRARRSASGHEDMDSGDRILLHRVVE